MEEGEGLAQSKREKTPTEGETFSLLQRVSIPTICRPLFLPYSDSISYISLYFSNSLHSDFCMHEVI